MKEKEKERPKKKHKHILKQRNFLDGSYQKCEYCNLAFKWNILKQRYEEVIEVE